jgi:NTE family protein
VIAVNINSDIVGRRSTQRVASQSGDSLTRLVDRLQPGLGEKLGTLVNAYPGREPVPGLMDVVTGAIHIMQYRITHDQLRADPPDLLISPRLTDVALMDFHRAEEAMAAGRKAAEQALEGGW